MKVYLASDHGGFVAKGELKNALATEYEIVDMGPEALNPSDDYPVYAGQVARAVVADPGSLGLLVCRSAEGMAIAANKIDGIRAAVGYSENAARAARVDEDANVLALAADEMAVGDIIQTARMFLTTSFSGAARHERRIEQISHLEQGS